jgi:thymidylate synthase
MYICESYDNALKNILEEGVWKENRTGVRTKSVFGILSKYKINEYFPLLTGRQLSYKACFAELLWFLSGSTNNNDLKELGCNFWTPWVDEEFEKKHGYESGDFGPVYGFQLRHFGADYKNVQELKGQIKSWEKVYQKQIKEENYPTDPNLEGQCVFPSTSTQFAICSLKKRLAVESGFDQLQMIVDKLKNNPNDRRILFSLWNPPDLDKMRLPPCHYTVQFYVNEDKLSCSLTQRSCDFPVGVPFNIAFYSAMTYMLAQQCDLVPWEFVHYTVDAHIYENQVDSIKEYLERPKPDSPKLILRAAKDIESYQIDDFELIDYNPQPKMKFEVAV